MKHNVKKPSVEREEEEEKKSMIRVLFSIQLNHSAVDSAFVLSQAALVGSYTKKKKCK